jgi:glucose-1-phosphate cytidylyltransferase
MAAHMKVAILAGGLGSRLSEVTDRLPKPMVEVGGKPLLWHIMKHYEHHGLREFVIALGYRGEVIKDYFLNYRLRSSSLVVRMKTGDVEVRDPIREDWVVHLLDSGERTQTGGRVRRIMDYVGREPILLTYGDGVSNVDIARLLAFHRAHGKAATVTATRPPARFGGLSITENRVTTFIEKPQIGEGWINGGFFVFEPRVRDYLGDRDDLVLEREPMERLAAEGELVAYPHDDFWQCMDTLRDVRLLEELWTSGAPPWKTWAH